MPDRPHLFIEHNGRRLSYRQFSHEINIALSTLYQRKRDGIKVGCLRDMRKRVVRINGRQRTLGEWAEEVGITRAALRVRLNRRWPAERLLEPMDPRGAARVRVGLVTCKDSRDDRVQVTGTDARGA